ncbi:MAG: tetraacyldisaccharide 4'-kinase [Gammaproteobacteria bacterium]
MATALGQHRDMISPGFIEELWYGSHPLSLGLAPLGWAYAGLTRLRWLAYTVGMLPVQRVPVPVIIIGNITVGGTGKTPLTIWLANHLRSLGHRPGIISRGYGGARGKRPQQVRPDSNPYLVGDEPVLMARRTGCPVAVSPRRYVAARELLEHTDCDVLLCDDGLQHLSLGRDLEIAVVDGDRRFGNGRCLPAGPLREPVRRLKSVAMVVCSGRPGRNEYAMEYDYGDLRSLTGPERTLPLESLRGQRVHAVAGIGNPARFFSYLRGFDLRVLRHEFPDHHRYTAGDLDFEEKLPLVMTEKDAVKCESFAGDEAWYLPVQAQPDAAFRHRLGVLLEELFNGQETA